MNYLVKAGRISNAFGADFMAFFQPMLVFKDHPLREEESLMVEEEFMSHSRAVWKMIWMNSAAVAELEGVFWDLGDLYDDTN